MHAYNYTSFSLPSVVAANTMSPTDKARYNQERVDLHFQLIDDEDAREEDFLIVPRSYVPPLPLTACTTAAAAYFAHARKSA